MDGNIQSDKNNGNEIYQGFCPYCMNRVEPGEVCSVCGLTHGVYHASPHHLPPGTVLMGRYLVGRVLGEGGFGITYIGCDLRLEMKVAIKEYFPADRVSRHVGTSLSVMRNTNSAAVDYEKGMKKFLYEARTMARMEKQPQIVMVRDFFEENNTAYIVMEYVDGTNFMELVKQRGGKIPPDELFTLIEPLFGALSTVHKAGLLHRDISPDNLMLEDGMIRLLDFGCAREAATGMETMTIALKQGYGPIEQYQGKGQGPWTDIYALSATIYYCLTGKKPPQALDRTLKDELVPPRDLGVDISPARQQALLKGMAVNPGKRYRSVEELYAGLYTTAEEDTGIGAAETVPEENSEQTDDAHSVTESAEQTAELTAGGTGEESQNDGKQPFDEQTVSIEDENESVNSGADSGDTAEATDYQIEKPGKKKAKNKRTALIITCIVIAAVVLVAVYFAFSARSGSSGSSDSPVSSLDAVSVTTAEELRRALLSNETTAISINADLSVDGGLTVKDHVLLINSGVAVSVDGDVVITGSEGACYLYDGSLDLNGSDLTVTENASFCIDDASAYLDCGNVIVLNSAEATLQNGSIAEGVGITAYDGGVFNNLTAASLTGSYILVGNEGEVSVQAELVLNNCHLEVDSGGLFAASGCPVTMDADTEVTINGQGEMDLSDHEMELAGSLENSGSLFLRDMRLVVSGSIVNAESGEISYNGTISLSGTIKNNGTMRAVDGGEIVYVVKSGELGSFTGNDPDKMTVWE